MLKALALAAVVTSALLTGAAQAQSQVKPDQDNCDIGGPNSTSQLCLDKLELTKKKKRRPVVQDTPPVPFVLNREIGGHEGGGGGGGGRK